MKKATSEIKSQLRELRPFVKFNYDLRKKIAPQSIAKIRKYSRELNRLKSYPTIKYYRPRSITRKKAAKKISVLEPEFQKQFKIVPLADIPPEAKIKYKYGQLIGVAEKLDVLQIPFNINKFLKNPDKYVDEIQRRYKDYDTFRIKCGEHTVSNAAKQGSLLTVLESILNSPKQKILTKSKRQEVFHSIICYKTKGQELNDDEANEKLK